MTPAGPALSPLACAMKFLLNLMRHNPVRANLGPEDREAYRFANALRAATLDRQLCAIWLHPANELARAPKGRLRLQAGIARGLGLMSGAPDYLFLWPTGCMAIEFKSQTGSLSPNQRHFRAWCEQERVPYHIVRSTEQGLDLLREAGVLTR